MVRLFGAVVLLIVLIVVAVKFIHSLDTVSTDDAYVNGHVTFVAPRVAGQVARVLVDDNNRVHKGDLLLQLDREPYQVQVNIAQSAVESAQSDLINSQAEIRAAEGQTRSLRFELDHAMEDVASQVAALKTKVAQLASKRATLAKAQAEYDREAPLVKSGTASKSEFDAYSELLSVAKAQAEEALENVYQLRVSLGLPTKPASGDLADVPPDLDQNFSSVRQAQARLMQAASRLGVTTSFSSSPKEMVAEFYRRDPEGDINKIYAKLLAEAPAIKQAEAKLAAANRILDQARLNLRYCDVLAEIDGVVTQRAVNPGNNAIVGQSLMAVRSLTEVWVDANFKETQLADLRIGHPVDLDVDMYGRRHRFKGRISGFTIGTGSTLALLPPQNATGNFVKVVQRLPVRIDLLDYDPVEAPLFVGLSVTPHIHIREEATGPNAGMILQPYQVALSDSSTSASKQ